MVDNHVLTIHASETIPSVGTIYLDINVSQAETHVSNDDIVATYIHGIVSYANTVTWCTLSGNGRIRRDAQS